MDEGISMYDPSKELPEILDGERLYSKDGYLKLMKISKLDDVTDFLEFFFLYNVEVVLQQEISTRRGLFTICQGGFHSHVFEDFYDGSVQDDRFDDIDRIRALIGK